LKILKVIRHLIKSCGSMSAEPPSGFSQFPAADRHNRSLSAVKTGLKLRVCHIKQKSRVIQVKKQSFFIKSSASSSSGYIKTRRLSDFATPYSLFCRNLDDRKQDNPEVLIVTEHLNSDGKVYPEIKPKISTADQPPPPTSDKNPTTSPPTS